MIGGWFRRKWRAQVVSVEGSDEDARAVVTLVNRQGLHMRPARLVEVLAGPFSCEIRLVAKGREVDAKRMLDIVELAAERGDEVEVRARGPRAREAAKAVAKLLISLPNLRDDPEDVAKT